MANFYLMTTFVILLTGDEAAHKATWVTKYLPDQGATTSREGRLDSQRSRGLGRDVRVVDIREVQSHHIVEPATSTLVHHYVADGHVRKTQRQVRYNLSLFS
jgi:hypothetical protein